MSAAAPGRSRPLWSGGASPRPGDASATSCANGACGRVRAQTVRTAQDAGRRGRAREHPRPRVRRLRAAHPPGRWPDVRARRRRVGVRVPAGRPGEQGHYRPFRRAGPGREPGIGRVRHARLPLTEVEMFHTDRGGGFDNAKIDELLDVFDIGGSLSRKGDPYDNAVVESTNRLLKKELIYRNHYTSLEQLAPTPTTMCGGPTTKDSTPPSDTGAPTNSHNKDSSSKELSNTPLPIHWRFAMAVASIRNGCPVCWMACRSSRSTGVPETAPRHWPMPSRLVSGNPHSPWTGRMVRHHGRCRWAYRR